MSTRVRSLSLAGLAWLAAMSPSIGSASVASAPHPQDVFVDVTVGVSGPAAAYTFDVYSPVHGDVKLKCYFFNLNLGVATAAFPNFMPNRRSGAADDHPRPSDCPDRSMASDFLGRASGQSTGSAAASAGGGSGPGAGGGTPADMMPVETSAAGGALPDGAASGANGDGEGLGDQQAWPDDFAAADPGVISGLPDSPSLPLGNGAPLGSDAPGVPAILPPVEVPPSSELPVAMLVEEEEIPPAAAPFYIPVSEDGPSTFGPMGADGTLSAPEPASIVAWLGLAALGIVRTMRLRSLKASASAS